MKPAIFKTVLFIFIILGSINLKGQKKDQYIYPEDSLVKKNLEKWQDMKFGLLIHWGLYSQIGVVESWGLCSEDQSFQDRGGMNYTDYKEMYFNLIKKFNPQNFDPGKWADAAKIAGMKYLVFTTKHHDGFCMWDTKQTDFKVTGKDCPFHNNPKSDIVKIVFESFRNKGFMVGAYFSKPDWHCPFYWTPLLATPDRNNNYDIKKYPQLWKQFQDFTFNQIEELTKGYGKIDILWLDGGWVRPDSTINDEVISWGYNIPKWEQDVNIPRIARMSEKNQPGLIIVDRTVHGPYENYRTPEQSVPDKALQYPWESNMTLTQSWGYNFNPQFKSPEFIVRTLVDVVSKGGNFLLNVAPGPDGTFEDEAVKRLKEIGKWTDVNGEAIYNTRQWEKYGEGKSIRFTKSKDGKYLFVFVMDWPGDSLKIESLKTNKNLNVKLIGSKARIKSEIRNGVLTLILPGNLKDPHSRPTQYASVFKVSLN